MMREMQKIRRYKFGIRVLIVVVLGLFALNLSMQLAFATKFYPGGYNRCVASSGHSGIHSIEWACGRAVAAAQNACSTWLGAAGDSHGTTIVASAMTGTAQASLWGMCTDRANTSATMLILPPNGAQGIFSCGGSCNFTRSGTWGSPSSKGVTIDVAKFIQNATLTTLNGQPAYYMHVIIDRQHGGNDSYGLDWSDIWLVISNMPEIPEPEPLPDLCMGSPWQPGAYNASTLKSSDTYVDIKIQNFEDRFKTLQFGKWNDNKIYAMPTDKIAWHTCYYAGTPASANLQVSNVNGGSVYMGHAVYPPTISGSTTCLSSGTLANNYKLLKEINPWENKLILSGDAQIVWPGDEIVGGMYNVETKMYVPKHNGRQTVLTDAGLTFTEKAQTGRPTQVRTVWEESPSKDIYEDYPCSCGTNADGSPCTTTCRRKICTNKYTPNTLFRQVTVDYNDKKDEVSVDIPYNFDNHPGVAVSTGEDDAEAYSGETMIRIEDLWVYVTPRYNNVTVAAYATEVPSSKVSLYAYIADNINGSEEDTGNGNGCSVMQSRAGAKQCIELWNTSMGESDGLNNGGLLEGKMENKDNKFSARGLADAYRAFDAAAGDYMCFVASVWPATSGPDTQMGTGGDGQYRYSAPSCILIIKKPTFQVWGDMYANAGINAYVGTKYNVYNYYIGDINGKYRRSAGPAVYQGSWVENGLILRGSTTTMASGAATAKNSATTTKSGSLETTICDRSPLTIANKNCSNSTGGANIRSTMTNLDETVDYWLGLSGTGTTTSGGTVTLGGGGGWQTAQSATGRTIRYLKASGDVTINASTVGANTTYLVKAGGKVNIDGDIRYNNSGYSSLDSVPKVVVYGSNINVKCSVSEVDAILVTPGTFDTCYDYVSTERQANPSTEEDPEEDAREQGDPHNFDVAAEGIRSQDRLKVFGAVVSNSVKLQRIYGAAAWNTSKYPNYQRDGMTGTDGLAAEVFDYDSSVMLWGEYMSSSAESDTLQIMYQSELAPRY